MNPLGIFLILIICILGALYVAGLIRTYQMEHGALQEAFKKGSANSAQFDGDYQGIAHGLQQTFWKGKTISQSDKTGINLIEQNGVLEKKYSFAFFVGKSLRDASQDVIVLDYNQPGNPWWLNYALDEMVEVSSGKYLGKVQVHVMPGVVFTIGYFTLSK